jgi:hypothetical protein
VLIAKFSEDDEKLFEMCRKVGNNKEDRLTTLELSAKTIRSEFSNIRSCPPGQLPKLRLT